MLALLLAAAAATAPVPPVPEVSFNHSGLIERYCATSSADKPDDAVLAEIDARVDEFRQAWAASGPRLMAANVALTGRPYGFRETMATLHGCRDMPSYSAPLLIAVSAFTRAGAALPAVGVKGLERNGTGAGGAVAGTVAPMSGFTYLVWHESTHRYIGDILDRLPGATTPLLRKYAAEDGVTLSHVHLFALEKLVYRRLGLQREYEERVLRVKARAFRSAVRALEIVDSEGAEAFVEELRDTQAAGTPDVAKH